VQLRQHVVVPVVRHFEEETVAQVERELLKDRVCVRAGKGRGGREGRYYVCDGERGAGGSGWGGWGGLGRTLLGGTDRCSDRG
jgi:hypothetical protein